MNKLLKAISILLLLSCSNDDPVIPELKGDLVLLNQNQTEADVSVSLTARGEISYVLTRKSVPAPVASEILEGMSSSFQDAGKIVFEDPDDTKTIELINLEKYQDHVLYLVINETEASSSEEVQSFEIPNQLKIIGDDIASTENLFSFLVSVDGEIVMERYYNGNSATTINDCRSITKSYISMLIGIAQDKGYINSLDDTIADYLPAYYTVGLSDEKKNISIRHLLTMSSGLFWDESKYGEWTRADDEIAEMLQRDFTFASGTQWQYNTGACHMLSAILTEASGMSSAEFAEEYLLLPLGIEEGTWELFETGYFNGGAGLSLYPRSFVKLGQMMLNGGMYDGIQVISEEYVTESTSSHFEANYTVGDFSNNEYGFLWWLDRANSSSAFTGWGYGGQFLYCIPESKTVIFSTSNMRVDFAQAISQEQNTIDIIVNRIVPALK